MVMQRLCSYIWLRWLGSWLWVVCRYCVLLITGDDPASLAANKAFLDFASANSKDVLRFAYVYQRQQQPLCQALLQNQGAHSAQVSGQNTHSPYFTKPIPKVKSSAARLKTRKSFLVAAITAAHPGQRFGNHCFATIITFLSVIATKKQNLKDILHFLANHLHIPRTTCNGRSLWYDVSHYRYVQTRDGAAPQISVTVLLNTDRWWFSRGGARLVKSCTVPWAVAGMAARKTSTTFMNSWSSFRRTPPIWLQTPPYQNSTTRWPP